MKELEDLKKYLLSKSTSKAIDHYVFPLFQKLFGNKFKKEGDAQGADGYVEGKIIIELKSDTDDFLPGYYQALHYEKKGLSFSSICVIAHKFIGVWKIKDLPKGVRELIKKSDPLKAPNEVGRISDNKTNKALKKQILDSAIFLLAPSDLEGFFEIGSNTQLVQFVQVLKNLDADRIQIAPQNFIGKIELMKDFFDDPLQAIHSFYAIVGYWNATSKVIQVGDSDYINVTEYITNRASEPIFIKPRWREKFRKFVESHYVFTNEGSGLTVDYYFSRFDEVITKIKPEYAIQHGIFFTDINLSKFALWFVHNYYEKKLSDKYIVLDPAGGSGNLVTSWRGHIKHKIVSELQPDLLRTIERRMKLDSEEVQAGFTIIPKTSENKGLNFLDRSAEEYVSDLMKELNLKNIKLDKPIAFLLNPPYKNTDENAKERIKGEAVYDIHQSIIDITGNDASKERYLGFLGQILNIAKLQMGHLDIKTLNFDNVTIPKLLDKKIKETPIVLIFTPTSWLLPRPTYVDFRKEWDNYFKYEDGFIVLGNEFFKIKGRFPISFTIWRYNYNKNDNKNIVKVRDLTHVTKKDLEKINWAALLGDLKKDLSEYVSKTRTIRFDNSRGEIRELLPMIMNVKSGSLIRQSRLNLYRNRTTEESQLKIVSGFPLEDVRHTTLKDPHGFTKGNFLGFMDDNTPVRINQDNYNRLSNLPDRVWFRLDISFADVNKSKCLNLPPNVKGYCAYNLESAIATFSWFAITKALNGRYPVWANQSAVWKPNTTKELEKEFYSLCFVFGLAENRCVVTKFEKDNPVKDAPELFVDNPLCPANSESFWSTTLEPYVAETGNALSLQLMNLIKDLYKLWNMKYCKSGFLYNVGLENEPYFKYFDYEDFLTPYSGLIQIKKYAEINSKIDLLNLFDQITAQTKDVKNKIYNLLIRDFKYFE